ncbi:hypothetical protein FNH22_28935 [Fulvivirga sp. M361]|uniref:antibiotic biosynthesis monooxygenase n=1 Tax=Fulvivirga sp. M361 TaxID=2594266 RepID=UPI00117B0237|nr:antibiotic biosynthesis monooxygenase [Fulvivirga sp. M361]TRX48622.1 hypothetical protein FNH22_28935 [Fulvivirga sp. M361]
MYVIQWKYKVKPEETAKFEREYGAEGAWSGLFNQSKDYLGSYLYKSEEEKHSYLLVDTWTDKGAYEKFRQLNKEIYNRLSLKFEGLYDVEERGGTYFTIA